MNKNILITGASSGLGAELAKLFASENIVLGLLGRNEERLIDTRDYCISKGARVLCEKIDILETREIITWIEKFDNEFPIDLIIANAGITYAIDKNNPLEPRAGMRDIFNVNYFGVINTINPILRKMSKRRSGHAVIISSLSAYRGIPLFPTYSASKAAIKTYYEALRGHLAEKGVFISIVCPGFIKTPMTRNINQPMLELNSSALKIKKGIEKKKFIISFPVLPLVGLTFIKIIPQKIADYILMKIFFRKSN